MLTVFLGSDIIIYQCKWQIESIYNQNVYRKCAGCSSVFESKKQKNQKQKIYNNLHSAHHCFMASELGALISHVSFQTKQHWPIRVLTWTNEDICKHMHKTQGTGTKNRKKEKNIQETIIYWNNSSFFRRTDWFFFGRELYTKLEMPYGLH